MLSYLDRLRTAPLADLEATATRAVRNAVAAAHAAGRSTVGQDDRGQLVRTFPDGREVVLNPAKEPKKQAKTATRLYVDPITGQIRRQRRADARAAAALKIIGKGKELRRAINGALALAKGPAKPSPSRKRQKGLDR